MHFSKTYAQLLVTLPPEIRNNPFEYRKLKQLINQTTSELVSLGLGPVVLRSLREHIDSTDALVPFDEHDDSSETLTSDSESISDEPCKHTIVYEIASKSSVLEPRLRLSSTQHVSDAQNTRSATQPVYHVNLPVSELSVSEITRALHPPITFQGETHMQDSFDHFPEDLIIPLPSDTAFCQLLASTLSSLSCHLDNLHDRFKSTLATLAVSVSSTARPVSSSAPRSFTAYSITDDNATSLIPHPGGDSDLYTWREIFRLYVEAEIFESVRELNFGERKVEDTEEQLKLFAEHIQGKKSALVLSKSKEALDVFLNLNEFILNLRKFQLANSEATRKILKKHVKRTALPIPTYILERYASASACSSNRVELITRPSTSLPRLLVQAIGEVLLSVIPHIDDYLCPICTAIAFKPIRLSCGHFFCLRCLVKMQRRGMGNCAMCRAPTVFKANRSNVDYGLLNFIADWFPIESREKQRINEQEVIQEQLQALGIADAHSCRIM